MSSFLYQPHIHTNDGVLTPDLMVDHLLLSDEQHHDRTHSLAVNLLSNRVSLQDVLPGGCASAALAFVSGGRGALDGNALSPSH